MAALHASRSPGPYDRIVALLTEHMGDLFMPPLHAIRAEHARKPSLIGRLDKAGLTGHD